MKENKIDVKLVGDAISGLCIWLFTSFVIWVGWKILAVHLGLPNFNYLEILVVRTGLSMFVNALRRKGEKQIKV